MKIGMAVQATLVVLLLGAGAARADTVVVNPFGGQWATSLGGTTPGTVKFTAVSETDGANALQAMGGHLCGAPTTYYHGDYTDTPSANVTDRGTMTACIVTAGHLVGRWQGSGDAGDVDVTLNSAKNGFDGSFNSTSFQANFTYSGTFTAHFPGDGCCVTATPPSGGALSPPTTFCPGTALDFGPFAYSAKVPCVTKKSITPVEKLQASNDLFYEEKALVDACIEAFKGGENYPLLLLSCRAYAEQVGATQAIINDPPDRSYQLPTVPPTLPPIARQARGRCPRGLNATQCAALNAAMANYANAVSVTANVAGYVAKGANRVAGAVQANSPAAGFFQQAYGKVNAGALATDLTAEHLYGQRLATLLRAYHLDIQLSARQVKKTIPKLYSRVITNQVLDTLVANGAAPSRDAARKLLVAHLMSISGPVSSSALGPALPTSAFDSQYRSISLSELAAIVTGLSRTGDISSAAAQTLTADLLNAQSRCRNASKRISAMQQFISDAHAQAATNAGFLKLGAQPLTASNVAASSCQ
jgi:hypothetical protein